jgi:hypothetical protein
MLKLQKLLNKKRKKKLRLVFQSKIQGNLSKKRIGLILILHCVFLKEDSQ